LLIDYNHINYINYTNYINYINNYQSPQAVNPKQVISSNPTDSFQELHEWRKQVIPLFTGKMTIFPELLPVSELSISFRAERC
jgi:hypothetical protein